MRKSLCKALPEVSLDLDNLYLMVLVFIENNILINVGCSIFLFSIKSGPLPIPIPYIGPLDGSHSLLLSNCDEKLSGKEVLSLLSSYE